jgi:hypothetical protein
MTSAFSFGFSGDDIDIDIDEDDLSGIDERDMNAVEDASKQLTGRLMEPQRHDMGEWVSYKSLLGSWVATDGSRSKTTDEMNRERGIADDEG